VPHQVLEYLGVVVNSLRLSFFLPPEKVKTIVKRCNDIISDKSGCLKLGDLAKVMGNFSWAIPSVPFAQGHFRTVQNFFLSYAHEDFIKIVCLSKPAKDDLIWWASHLEQRNGKPFFPDNPNLIFFSDASLSG
jgi:hypothetical protein